LALNLLLKRWLMKTIAVALLIVVGVIVMATPTAPTAAKPTVAAVKAPRV
jgi:hypothetical protein